MHWNTFKLGFIPLILFLYSLTLSAQARKGLLFEQGLHFGTVVKHSPNFIPEITHPTFGLDLHFNQQTYGKKSYQKHHRYLQCGYLFKYINFSNRAIFGSAISFNPTYSFIFLRKEKFHMSFRLGSGLAYFNKPFHITKNASNNVIGSNLNAMVAFSLGATWKFSDYFSLIGGSNFTHYSNGGTTQPNLGINVASFSLGIQYSPNPVQETDYSFELKPQPLSKKIGFDMLFAVAFHESGVPNGPLYPTYIHSFLVSKLLNPVNRFHLGVELEYSTSTLQFMNHTGQFEDIRQRRKNATRLALVASDEILLGNASLYFSVGTYLSRSFLQPWFLYAKLGTRYYIPLGEKKTKRLHLGIYMKAHQFTAEYYAFGLGFAF